MNSQKLDGSLQLALSMQIEESDLELSTMPIFDGFEEAENVWELIVRYHGNLSDYQDLYVSFEPLLGGYGIAYVETEKIEAFSSLYEIEYIEKPQRVSSQVMQGLFESCFYQTMDGNSPGSSLDGKGVWIGIIDSGIAYTKKDFWSNGNSAIAWMYDQDMGRLMEKQEIEDLLLSQESGSRFMADVTGHGTAVAQIARRGAPESELVIVKLGRNKSNGFYLTTNLMRAVNLMVIKAQQANKPIAINISYGNNYGSHDGTSLLEQFLDVAAEVGRCVICVAAGNEGAGVGHFSGVLSKQALSYAQVPFSVGRYERSTSLQIWSYAADQFDIWLTAPGGDREKIASANLSQTKSVILQNTKMNIWHSVASPYQNKSECYMVLEGIDSYVDTGIWNLELESVEIKNGYFRMYLPGAQGRSEQTGFLRPNPYATITIPATARKVISVGAISSAYNAYASFSGRGAYMGEEAGNAIWQIQKPDLVAPGVGIILPDQSELGQEQRLTGTSFAAPFVTAAAALLMQWGIVNGNDPYLYGEKVKAYLQRGASRMKRDDVIPNAMTGWGRLCVANSLPG